MTMEFGTITVNDNTSEVAIGEVRKISMNVQVPEESNYDLEFSFNVPSNSSDRLELLDAVIESVGDNLPCVDKLMNPTISGM